MARTQATGSRAPTGFERILVPLDGSELAETALPHATAFARMYAAHVHFLRVEEQAEDLRMSVWGLAASEPDDLQLRLERADRYLDSVAADCSLASVSKEARPAHRIGEAVAQVAIDRDADLIAMATHGRGASRMLIGSVADKVIRGTGCSILLLRATGKAAELP